MKAYLVIVMGVMLLMSIGIVSANNLSEVSWDYAVSINPEKVVGHLNVSEQNRAIIAQKIIGYQRASRDGVKSFNQGKIQQLVISQGNNIIESYSNLSANEDFLWKKNVTTFRFIVQNMDSKISTDKIVVFVFYDKNCNFIGYAWAYAEEIEITSTYIKDVYSCYVGGDVQEPTDTANTVSNGNTNGDNPSGDNPSGDNPSGDNPGGHDGGEDDPSDPGFG
jgi:hypothetical protein